MRKVLISILLGLSVVWTIYFMIYGVEALGVKGFIGLKEENELLEKKIENLQKTINSNYKNALVTLDSTKDTLIDSKTEYENQAELSSLNSANYTSEKYEIDYLWTRLGNFAKDEKIVIKMDVQDTKIDDLYDLQFTAAGPYSGITQFIYDIENDSDLGFKIDDFTMTGANEIVVASFTCNEIHVDLKKLEKEEIEETDGKEDENTTNTTNTTNMGNDTANENTTENTTKNTTENEEKNTTEGATSNDKETNNTKENEAIELYNEMMGMSNK